MDVISVLVGCLLYPNLRASRANLMIIKRTFHLIAVKNSSIKGIQTLDGKLSYTLLNPVPPLAGGGIGVTVFTDAEATFVISITKNSARRVG